MNPYHAHIEFREAFPRALEEAIANPDVVGFKSIVCYRTGLDVSVQTSYNNDFAAMMEQNITMAYLKYEVSRLMRLEYKALNDYVVNEALRVAGDYGKAGKILTCNRVGAAANNSIKYNSTRDLEIMISP